MGGTSLGGFVGAAEGLDLWPCLEDTYPVGAYPLFIRTLFSTRAKGLNFLSYTYFKWQYYLVYYLCILVLLVIKMLTNVAINEGLPVGVLVPLFPSKIALCSHTFFECFRTVIFRILFPCSQKLANVPLFPSIFCQCSLVPQNPWETLINPAKIELIYHAPI